MKEFLILLGVILLWITLNRWVLPWFGIPTCMSGGCAVERCHPSTAELSGSVCETHQMPSVAVRPTHPTPQLKGDER
jgi:hypothetical protein